MTQTTRPSSIQPQLLVRSVLCILCLLVTSAAQAQTAPQVVINDSRGTMVGTTLTIGYDLMGEIKDGAPQTKYGFKLFDEAGLTVAEASVVTDKNGHSDSVQIWDRTSVKGCAQELGPPASLGVNVYDDFEEASLDLDGRTFDLWVYEFNTSNTVQWIPIFLEETQHAMYYWSDIDGEPKCSFERDETVYLSVFQGALEEWSVSRVFVLRAPADKDQWDVGMQFLDVRVKKNCDPDIDTCYHTGTLSETVPLTVTTPVEGIMPVQGEFLAIIRDANNGLLDGQRYLCDQATESLMTRGQVSWDIDLADSEDGWGCPPCPD